MSNLKNLSQLPQKLLLILFHISMKKIFHLFYQLFSSKVTILLSCVMEQKFLKILFFHLVHFFKVRKSFLSVSLTVFILSIQVMFCGCVTSDQTLLNLKKKKINDSFSRLYNFSFPDKVFSSSQSKKNKYTLSAVDLPLTLFCVNFSDLTGYGIVCSADLSSFHVNLEFKDADPLEIIELLSKQLNKDFILRGNTFFIGSLKKGDRSFLVRKCNFMSIKDAASYCQNFISEHGKVYVTHTGIISVVDIESVISSLSRSLDSISSFHFDTFICQLFFVVDSQGWNLSAGAKATPSGKMSYLLSKGQGGEFDFSDIGAELELVFSGGYDKTSLLASPMFLTLSDSPVSWNDGQIYPIPLKNVSSEGTVTTQSYQFKNTGLQVNLTLIDCHDFARISCSIGNSQITGWVEDQPILNTSHLTSSFNAQSGRIYLIGSLNQLISSNSVLDSLTFKSNKNSKDISVYFRFYRIDHTPLRPFSRGTTNLSMVNGKKIKANKVPPSAIEQSGTLVRPYLSILLPSLPSYFISPITSYNYTGVMSNRPDSLFKPY